MVARVAMAMEVVATVAGSVAPVQAGAIMAVPRAELTNN